MQFVHLLIVSCWLLLGLAITSEANAIDPLQAAIHHIGKENHVCVTDRILGEIHRDGTGESEYRKACENWNMPCDPEEVMECMREHGFVCWLFMRLCTQLGF